MSAQRAALRYYFADHAATLWRAQRAALSRERADDAKRLDATLKQLNDRAKALALEQAGLGGSKIAELEGRLEQIETQRDERRQRAGRYSIQLEAAGLAPVADQAGFRERVAQIAETLPELVRTQAGHQNRLTELAVAQAALAREAEELNAELLSLRARRSNLPKRSLDLRALMCRELELDEEALPYAGELIQVLPEQSRWEGAAERVLRGFALSLLVPEPYYRAVSDWINARHLGTRIVYYRVPTMAGNPRPIPGGDRERLADKLEIKQGPFEPWLENELARRADYTCVGTMAEFRHATTAVTVQGQIKGTGGRHEKDDRSRIDDRSGYVLGWSNEQKIQTLIDAAKLVQGRQNTHAGERGEVTNAHERATRRADALKLLAEQDDYTQLDWQSAVRRITEIEAELRRLRASSTELERVSKLIEDNQREIDEAQDDRDEAIGQVNRLDLRMQTATDEIVRAENVLAEPARAGTDTRFPAIAERLHGASSPHSSPATRRHCRRRRTWSLR